jgi:hypothetical protein
LNKYDVIYLDMSWFISSTENIKNVVKELQKQIIEDLYATYPEAEKKEALSRVLLSVSQVSGGKFIFVIDEWDALFREAKEDTELQSEYIQLLREIFKGSFTDDTIEAAYITGILPIKKYGTQSAMTDFKEFTMLQPEPLEQYVGFTEEEVRTLCEHSDLKFSDMQRWYDGYVMGDGIHVYSPKSVIDALERKRIRNYWTQTETYESLKIYIDMDFDGLQEAIVQMLGGARYPIDAMSFQNDMTSIQCQDDVLTLLVHLGYLAYDADEQTVYIPNEEVRQEFIRAVKKGKHKEFSKDLAAKSFSSA